jgi:hypothetical protein
MKMSGALPLIPDLIEGPDVAETVRDQVAAILSLELQNQFALAKEKAAPNAADYNVPVYVENGRPFEASGDKPATRFINVQMTKVSALPANARIGNQKTQSVFFIDCVACGNDDGNFRDDKSAAHRAWRVCRLVRRILMADVYAYLGMRGVVGSRVVPLMEAGTPERTELNRESALAYVIIRVTLEAQFLERSIASPTVVMEPINFEIDPVSGEVTTEIAGG